MTRVCRIVGGTLFTIPTMTERSLTGYKTYKDLEELFSTHWFTQAKKHARHPTSWRHLTANSCILETTIRNHPECPWDIHGAIFNNNLSWIWFHEQIEIALAVGKEPYSDKRRGLEETRWLNRKAWHNTFTWEYLSEHPCLTMEAVLEYRDKPWHYPNILSNNNIHWEDILRNCIEGDLFRDAFQQSIADDWPVEMDILCSENTTLSIRYIMANLWKNWNWEEIIHRSDITFDVFDEIIRKEYYKKYMCPVKSEHQIGMSDREVYDEGIDKFWNGASQSPALTWKFINEHLDYPWRWDEVSRHKCITPYIIDWHPQHEWDWKRVSENPNITLEWVIQHIEHDWSWVSLSFHRNITWRNIQEHPNRPWEWRWVSLNPDVGWDTVREHPDKPWDYEYLVRNDMKRYAEQWKTHERLQWIASRRIHRFWRDVTSNPVYRYARSKLESILEE